MIDFVLNKNSYSRTQKTIFFCFILMCWLNFGNYSWLQYDINSIPRKSSIYLTIRNLKFLVSLLTLIFLLLNRVYVRKIIHLIKTNFTIYLVCLLFLLNSFISENILISLTYSVWLFTSILIINLVTVEVKHINDLFKLLRFGSIITLFLVVPAMPYLFEDNEASYFSSKNYYAFALLIYLFSDIYIPKNKRKIINYLRRFIIFLIIIALLLSGRRVAFFCALLSILNYFVNYDKKYLILLPLLLFFFSNKLLQFDYNGFQFDDSRTIRRLKRINKSNNYEDSSYEERVFIWEKYFEAFKDSPLIGNGLNTYETNLSKHYSGELDGLGYHNTYLQVLVESGLLGITFFMIFIFNSIRNSFRIYGIKYLSLTLSVLLIYWFETNFIPGQNYFIASLTILFFGRYYYERD